MIWIALIGLALIALTVGTMTRQDVDIAPDQTPTEPSTLNDLFVKWANVYSVKASTLKAIGWQESRLIHGRANPSDPSAGIMGIEVPTGRRFADLAGTDNEVLSILQNDDDINIHAGAGYWNYLVWKFQSRFRPDEIIQMYNLGETRFRAGKRSTQYALAVIERQKLYAQDFDEEAGLI